VHHGLDDQHIVHDGGHAEQVVVARRKVLVEPEVARAGFLLRAVVDNVLDQLQADAAFQGALLGMGLVSTISSPSNRLLYSITSPKNPSTPSPG
jgi:hypothetical protein